MFSALLKQKNELLFSSAYDFFIGRLGITEEQKKIITIKDVKRLRGASGTCTTRINQSGQLISVNIKIANYGSTIGMLEVLAHELVHARQALRGEFSIEQKKVKRFGFWPTTVVERYHKNQNLSEVPYYDQECEQEAHTLSYTMMLEYMAVLNRESDELKEVSIGKVSNENTSRDNGVIES